MKIIPAIDILGGRVVRLYKGSFDQKKEFDDDPVRVAQEWHEQGATYLHVVDLDGAKSGKPVNADIIKKLLTDTRVPAEVSGGIRSVDHVKMYVEAGADRVALGTAVTQDISFLDNPDIKRLASKIAVSCDAKSQLSAHSDFIEFGTSGWVKEVQIPINQLLGTLASAGVKYLNYTNRAKDGTLEGLTDIETRALNSFLDMIESDVRVLYAGGIASIKDIKKLASLQNEKLAGVIVGMALYERKFSLREAQGIADAR